MDIKHTSDAVAVLTLGKDMTFRDYAQVRRRGKKEEGLRSIYIHIILKGCLPYETNWSRTKDSFVYYS